MPRLNSVGAKFITAFALILPIFVWQLGKDAFQSFQRYQDISNLERQNTAANSLIAGVYEILMERLATNNALQAEQPADSAVLNEIEKRRSVAVQKISAAFADLSVQEFPNKAALLNELKAAREKADSYRVKADAAVKQSKSNRDADTVKNLFVSLSELSSTSQKVWGAALASTSHADPELARLSNIRLLAWNLRDIAGFERSHVAAAIAAKAAIPADKLAAIGEIRAQIALMWRFLEGNFKAGDHPAVIKGVQLAKDGYFGKFQPLAEQMRKVSAEGASYPMSLPQWVDTTTPQLFTLLEIMYGAGVASEAHTAAQQHAAIISLILSCGLLALGACAMAASLLVIIRVVRPLKAMTAAMQHLAKGNVDVAVPALDRNDEIGHMAKTVVVFRDAAVEKVRLQSEAAEREKKSAAERDAAMAQVASEFEAAVGGIVTAAAAGDFTQRVDLRGKTGLVLSVGTALNSLGENTNKVLDDLTRMLNSLSEGNLTDRITGSYQGNFAVLKDKANMTAECIGAIIADIKRSTHEVTNASAEISTSTTDLSQRTEQQAASLEETSSSMEEMTATVKKNAESAQQANQLAVSTREIADRGGEVVSKAVNAMARIEESSRKISDIIGVIDEIARQTNLLALNAAVEAARAGEAGRGFAVVATEVRSLAQRASQAAKDIKELITNSSAQVKDGVGLVNHTGASLNEIVESIKKVSAVVSDIANASTEQSGGIEQINKALTQMDEVTQQNSALVEENAATAKTLEQQAKAMDERIAFFRLGDEGGQAGSARPAVRAESAPSSHRTRHTAAAPRRAAG
jgi:methyl-accepting chemotaxis protein